MAEETFVLTKETYFDPKRPHVSVSQIKDFIKDPAFYKRRYIDRDPEVQFEQTDPVKRGKIVDDVLTGGRTDIYPKVLKKDDPETYAIQENMSEKNLVGKATFEQAMAVIDALREHPVWADETYPRTYQEVLEGEIAGMKVCGMADRIDSLPDKKFRLIDLKVVSAVKLDSPRKWMWNVRDFFYDGQFAMYRQLKAVKEGVPKTNVECYHVVAAFVEPGIVKVRAYRIPNSMIDDAEKVLAKALAGIKSGKFDPVLTTWDDVEVLPYGIAGDDLEAESDDES